MAGGEQWVDTATVLFTDLVGSTALRSRIGEEAADRLRVKHDALINGAIEAHRGTVVKHTGDGAMATFSAAVDAVASAVAIQQAVDSHNRRSADERIEVRIGISTGDVTFTGDDCFGLPVIEAQRLEAAADGGQILCAEIVRHLARGRGGHEFASVGDLELKGIAEPVPAASVRWEPVQQVAMPRETPLPPVLAAPSAFDLSGRTDELTGLLDAWKQSADGKRKVVLISGEPGVGKTRLATEAARAALHAGALVIGGRCDEELVVPYQPFAEALRFQSELDDVPSAWLGPLAGEMTRIVPELGARISGRAAPENSDPESERARLFEAVTGWLRTTAASVPVFLVLDDLHWADRPTLLLLRHLINETPHDSLFIVGTYRSTDLDRSHPLATMLADLRRNDSVSRLALDGLTADGVAELLERSAGHDLDDAGNALARAVHAETAGNPFFVGEIVRHLVESGALFVRDGRWTSDLTLENVGLPEGVREVVGRRLSRLDDETQRLLSNAAVIGQEFGLPVLAAVAGIDEDRVVDLLDAVRSTSLVNEVGLDRYRFAHALVRATLLEELTTTRRVRTHRKVAETIEARHAHDLDAVVGELAFHYGEAAAADPAKAIEYARRAGAQALAKSAPDDAVRWYSLALEHLDADGDEEVLERVELLTLLADAEWVAGIGDPNGHARIAARLAQDAGLHEPMANALFVTTRVSFNVEQESDPEKIELLEYVIERLDDPSLRARAMAILAIEMVYTGDARRGDTLRAAMELAQNTADDLAVIHTTLAYFSARTRSDWSADDLRREYAMHEDARRAAERLGDSYRRAVTTLQCFFAASGMQDGAGMRLNVARMAEEAPRSLMWARGHLLAAQVLAVIEGRLVEADALSLELYDVWRTSGMVEAAVYRATTMLGVRREQARLESVIDGWRAFVAANPGAASSAAVVAFCFAETGDLDAAASWFEEWFEAGFEHTPDEAGWPLAIGMWAEVAAVLNHRKGAAALHALLEIADGAGVGTGGISLGPAARLLARLETVLGRPDDAERHFGAAVEQCRAKGSPVWTARALLDWAGVVLDRGDATRAAQLVDDADAAIGSLTLPRLQQQSAALRARL
jgi:predicted ATPase/class 3 adenylate cyclase/tetratricopeptide (TPR) repeat protein